jgi:hypothetical protein
MSRNSVDFPHPLGPINTVVRPCRMARSVGCKDWVCPNLLDTPISFNMVFNYGSVAIKATAMAGHFCHSERSEESSSACYRRPFAALRVTKHPWLGCHQSNGDGRAFLSF